MTRPIQGRPYSVDALLLTHRQSHDLTYWLNHTYINPIQRGLTHYCLCEVCVSEIDGIQAQMLADYDSRLESLRMARNEFLGLDPDEEWRRRAF
jgi:hypothetical protein